MTNANTENKAVKTLSHDSDELMPAEVQSNTPEEPRKLAHEPLQRGYTVDETGVFNNYAVELQMSESKYPSRQQQRRYLIQGTVAILFLGLILWTAFVVS